MALSRGIDKAAEAVGEAIKKMATPINEKNKKEIMQVATIAGNNDPTIGDVLADAFLKVGKDGVITVEEGRQSETDGRSGRRHAVRPRLSLAALRHQSGRADGRARKLPTS